MAAAECQLGVSVPVCLINRKRIFCYRMILPAVPTQTSVALTTQPDLKIKKAFGPK